MNWKRGLLRVWVVTSAVWLILVGSNLAIDSSTSRQIERPPTEAEVGACMDYRPGPWCSADIVEAIRSWTMPGWSAAVFTLAPPLLVLGLGLAITWVIRGFRSN